MPQTNLDHVRAFSDKCIDACLKWILAPRDNGDPPPLLYHFTDLDGLVGILNSRALRLSLVTALNDCSEIDHGIELADEFINKRLGRRRGDFLDRVRPYIQDPNLVGGDVLEFAIYVTSFCGQVDQSRHWLHYGQSGKGAALGFDPAHLPLPGRSHLERAEYGRGRQETLIAGLLAQVEDLRAKESSDPADFDLLDRIAGSTLGRFLRFLVAAFKTENFKMEGEWRLISYEPVKNNIPRSDGTEYLSRGGLIVPYQEIKFAPNALKSVVLGYSSAMRKDDLALRMLAHAASPSVTIEKSTVPVRG
jgi:hypothetical protein